MQIAHDMLVILGEFGILSQKLRNKVSTRLMPWKRNYEPRVCASVPFLL